MEATLGGQHYLWKLGEPTSANPSREETLEGHLPASMPDSNQPASPWPHSDYGHESHEVLKELMAVKQELAKVKVEFQAKLEEQERKTKELALEVEGLGIEVNNNRESNQPPRGSVEVSKELRPNVAFQQYPEEAEVPSPTIDKKGIVHHGQEVYMFNESVWDSLIFLGYIQGSYEGVDMIILGILNLMIQLFFCSLLIALDLADTGAEVYKENVNAFIQWRVGVAHQAEHYDPLTNSSLAQRVCLKYGGTVQSRRHQMDLAVATSYYDVSQLSELQGPGLLMLALALWMALILKEVISILGFIRMLVALTFNGDGTTDLHKDRVSEQLKIRSMSNKRAWVIFITVVVPRLFIALMLGYVGIFYLRQTFSVEEIILNAMALGFVLEIDELLFHFLPAAARYLVIHISAVPLDIKLKDKKKGSMHRQASTGIRRGRKLVGAILERTRLLLIILVIVVIYFRFTIIAQIQDSMEISQLILCEGNLQFIFKESRATKVLHVAQTVDKSNDDRMDLPIEEIQDVFDGILQATDLCNILADKQDIQDRLQLCADDNKEAGLWCKRCPYLLSLGPEAHLFKHDSLEDTISLVTATRNEALLSLDCKDRYTSASETFIPAPLDELLLQAGANFSAGLCEDMAQYCLDPDVQIREVVRIFCPSQCQCDHGTSSAVDTWFFDRIGCAPTCQASVKAELTQLEDDLVLGKETCSDRDGGLSEEHWRPYVEDVERELLKRGLLYADGGFLYASESVRGFFAVKTDKDMMKFVSTILHPSNQRSFSVGGCTMRREPIDLLVWAKQAGSFCRWARMVKYVFGLNLCSHTILLSEGFYGFNALGGLCPLSCGIGRCSQAQMEGEIDSDLDAWYNSVRWGHALPDIFDCDMKNVVCLEVEKYAMAPWNWHSLMKITISEDSDERTTVYSAGLHLQTATALAHEKDVICVRPQNASSSCYHIDTPMVSGGWRGIRLRWRLTEVGTGQFLLMGSHGERHRACGLHWLNELGVPCTHGDTVSVMTSWHQMQVDAEIVAVDDVNAIIPVDPHDFLLQGAKPGMFAFRKALLEGGYNRSSGSIQVLYSLDLIGRSETVPFGSLALPTARASDAGPRFAACLPSPELSELRPDKKLCADSDFAVMWCSRFASQFHCESPLSLVRELFVSRGCESDLDGLSDDDIVATLCPEACAAQATCTWKPKSKHYYYYYYTFELAGCLHSDCECMAPRDMIQACWSEMNMTNSWIEVEPKYHNYYHWQSVPHADREILGSILKDGTTCFSEEAGFLAPQSFPTDLSDHWCYVKPTCLGSTDLLKPSDTCSWRPSYESECVIDRSSPRFCMPGPGPHSCGGFAYNHYNDFSYLFYSP